MAARCFATFDPNVAGFTDHVYRIVREELLKHGILFEENVAGTAIWGLRSAAAQITSDVRIYRFARRHGLADSADTLLRAITQEKSEEFRRYRSAQILDAGNVQDLRVLLREFWESEQLQGEVDPVFDEQRRNYFLQLADRLFIGGRKELLGDIDE